MCVAKAELIPGKEKQEAVIVRIENQGKIGADWQ